MTDVDYVEVEHWGSNSGVKPEVEPEVDPLKANIDLKTHFRDNCPPCVIEAKQLEDWTIFIQCQEGNKYCISYTL